MCSEIPLIDLRLYAGDLKALGAALHEAATSVGFLYLVNTELDPSGIFQISKHFFLGESADDKACFSIDTKNRGYGRFGQESLDVTHPGDQKEFFNIGMCKQDRSLKQLLPSKLAQDVEVLTDFQLQCHQLVLTLLEALATALDLPPRLFVDQHKHKDDNTSTLRLLRYPASSPGSQAAPRAGAHSDYGSLTLLFQEHQPSGSGLQVLPPTASLRDETAWQDVPVVQGPGTVLVNVGDALELQTGALYKSTLHRVVASANSSQADRYSIAFFAQPNGDALLESVVASDQVTSSDISRMEKKGIKAGEKLTADEHLQRRLNATYKDRKINLA